MVSGATKLLDRVARLFVGSLLLLPAFLAFALSLWYPALHTLALSTQSTASGWLGRLGLANYAALWQDPVLGSAIARSILVGYARLLAAVPLPVLTAWLWRQQEIRLRLVARFALSLSLALSAPAALAVLWRMAVWRLPLAHGFLAANASVVFRAYLLLEYLAFLPWGGALAITALLLAWRQPRPRMTVAGVLLLVAILALSSGLNSFTLPYVATGGGPLRQTTTLALHIFHTATQPAPLGPAAARASLLMVPSLGLGLLFGVISEKLGLQLVPAQSDLKPKRVLWHLPLSILSLGLIALPVLFLYFWGAGRALLFPGDPLKQAISILRPEIALLNGTLVPLLAIVFIQLPVTYLAALSLTLVRPFGAWGSRLVYVLFLASGFIPQIAVGIGLFDLLPRLRLLDTPPATGLPLLTCAGSLFVFRLYFARQQAVIEKARQAGQPAVTAFLQLALRPSLPVAVLAGMVSLLLAGQSPLWPLIVLGQRELFPLSVQLVLSQTQLADNPNALAAGAWLVLTCWGAGLLLIVWPVQALVLERLALTSHSPSTTETGQLGALDSHREIPSPATGGPPPGRRRGSRSRSHP